MPAALEELEKLRAVPYVEIKALRKYLDGHSPFETKHGVKGASLRMCLRRWVGRGWNQYNFGEMLELAGAQAVPAAKPRTNAIEICSTLPAQGPRLGSRCCSPSSCRHRRSPLLEVGLALKGSVQRRLL